MPYSNIKIKYGKIERNKNLEWQGFCGDGYVSAKPPSPGSNPGVAFRNI
jgi:hypothetical protein